MSGPARLPDWEQLAHVAPTVVVTMRRYLDQLACVLRPASVGGADLALRSLAAFLSEQAPDVVTVADISRRHIEDFIRWLAARPGRNAAQVTPATLAHRLGTLRMFFVRISEWDWPDAPARVPIIPGDLPRQDHPLPKALDDAAAARLLRAAQDQRRMLVHRRSWHDHARLGLLDRSVAQLRQRRGVPARHPAAAGHGDRQHGRPPDP